MEIRFNKENILKSIGIECSCDMYYLMYMQKLVDELYRHNKNYNNKQYYAINDLKEILDNIEILNKLKESVENDKK